MKLIVFVSGNGTNLQAIIDACENHVLNATVSAVISNRTDAYAVERAIKHSIPAYYFPFRTKEMDRADYDVVLAHTVNSVDHDLIILAGWMHVFSNSFISLVKTPIINLHPALPGQFPGRDAVSQAYDAYQQSRITKTGIMVHHVVEEIDAGKVIGTEEVAIYPTDTLDTLRQRVQYYEKPLLLKSIEKVLDTLKPQYPEIIRGKVRNCYDIGYGLMAIVTSDRQSAFDRYICDIPGKGAVLNNMARFWFGKTAHIIPNHMVYANDHVMIVKKCQRIDIEVVVRGYITGSTSTSLWTHYNNGVRLYCGIKFPDGLVKNQKLAENVVTPTTKGEVDELISGDEIVQRGFVSLKDWQYIHDKALEVFAYSQRVAREQGYILVDTKYEFGRDRDGNILLIDEINTCDSSRYWLLNTYADRFAKGEEPLKVDKDMIRDYVKKMVDPYKEPIPEIPRNLIDQTFWTYGQVYMNLSGETQESSGAKWEDIVEDYFENIHDKLVVIMAGSEADSDWVTKIGKELDKFKIYWKVYYASAHKQPHLVDNIIKRMNEYRGKRRIVFVAVAGRSNALGGVLSANVKFPVINCPPFKDKIDMLTNINSSLQMPSNVPALTVLEPSNVALAIDLILNM